MSFRNDEKLKKRLKREAHRFEELHIKEQIVVRRATGFLPKGLLKRERERGRRVVGYVNHGQDVLCLRKFHIGRSA